jgi:hypothetical protein
LYSGLQQAADTLVSGQHFADRGRRTAESRQGPEDILQFFALGVEDMAQAEFLHRNGGKNLIDRVLPLDRRVDGGKAWKRHIRNLLSNWDASRKRTAVAALDVLCGKTSGIFYAMVKR